MENTTLTADQLQHLAVLLAASPFPQDVKAMLPQLIATATPEQLSQLYTLVVEADAADTIVSERGATLAKVAADAPARIAEAQRMEVASIVAEHTKE